MDTETFIHVKVLPALSMTESTMPTATPTPPTEQSSPATADKRARIVDYHLRLPEDEPRRGAEQPCYLWHMSCRLSELIIDCADPEALSRFWCAVLGYQELGREAPDDGIEIGPAKTGFGGAAPTLVFSRTASPKSQKLRLHFDVNPVDRDQDAELERLLSLGARLATIGQTGEEHWHALQDPEGNEFCLLRRQLPEL